MHSLGYRAKQFAFERARSWYRRALRILGPERGRRLTRIGSTVVRSLHVQPKITDDVVEWSRARGIEYVSLSPATTRSRHAPAALVDAPHPDFAQRLDARIWDRYLVCLPGARLWGANGLVILPDGSFAAQAIYDRRHLEADPAFSTPVSSRVVRKSGDYVTLLGEFSNTGNYYHWIHDGLLRLHGVLPHLPAHVRFLVPLNRAPAGDTPHAWPARRGAGAVRRRHHL